MEFVGRKVKVELQDGSIYDGFVHCYNTNIGKLSLEKVICHEGSERKKLVGLQHFFADEIADIIAEEEVLRNKSKGQTVKDRGHSVLKPKCSPAHLRRLQFLEPTSLLLKNQKEKDELTSSGNESTGSDSAEESVSNKEYSIIPKTDTLFYEAIAYIKKHQVMGLAMEGISIGREGQLCWIQMAVPDHVFLFDMLRLGQDGFDEGLASVLESEDILKVIHNCRMVSDMLHHQYSINLVNVFDTQVANVFVYRLWHHNDWPRYVDGLAACLVQHLDLTMEEVNWTVVRERFRESDEEVWLVRPPKRSHVKALVKNVKHLIALRQALMEKMMEEFVAGVNIYLTYVRDASKGDARKYMKEPYLLPMAFQDIRQFMISYASRNQLRTVRNKNTMKDRNGFRENVTSMCGPDVYFSRDSLWHAGSKRTGEKISNSGPVLGRYADKVADFFTNSETSSTKLAQNDEETTMDCSNATESAIPMPPSDSPHTDPREDKPEDSPGVREESGQQMPILTGTSLMRALIQDQAPEGGEDHSDLNAINIKPAGKMVVKKERKGKSGGVRPPVVIPDLNDYPPTGTYTRGLTEQERRMVARMQRRVPGPDPDQDWDDACDSVLAKPRSPQQRSPDQLSPLKQSHSVDNYNDHRQSQVDNAGSRETRLLQKPSSPGYSIVHHRQPQNDHSCSLGSANLRVQKTPQSQNLPSSYAQGPGSTFMNGHQCSDSVRDALVTPASSSGGQLKKNSPSRLQTLLALIDKQNG